MFPIRVALHPPRFHVLFRELGHFFGDLIMFLVPPVAAEDVEGQVEAHRLHLCLGQHPHERWVVLPYPRLGGDARILGRVLGL